MRKARRRFVKFLPMFIGLVVGVSFICIGFKIPIAQVSGSVKSSILYFSNTKNFYTGDILGNKFGASFDGQITLSTGQEFSGEISVAATMKSAEDNENATTIVGFEVPAGSNVLINIDPREGRLHLAFVGPSIAVELIPNPDSIISIAADECDQGLCNYIQSTQKSIHIMTNPNTALELAIDLPKSNFQLSNLISVGQLRFWNTEIIADVIQKRSGLESGFLRFLATSDTEYKFQVAEIISIVPKQLSLRSINISKKFLSAQFSGYVNDVRGEIGTSSYSLKPNWLETLVRIPQIKIAIGILSIILGAVFSAQKGLSKIRIMK